MRRPRRNPANPVADRSHVFHGHDGDVIFEGDLWVPGALVLVGEGVNVGYDPPDTSSKTGSRFVHDFEGGVRVYRRAKSGERADKTYKTFPKNVLVLGRWLGMQYANDDEQVKEVNGSGQTFLCCTSDGKKLVVVHKTKGVQYLLHGGKMHVRDWIYK